MRHRWGAAMIATSPRAARHAPPLWRLVAARAVHRRGGLALLALVMAVEAGIVALAPWPMKVLVDYVLLGQPMPAAVSAGASWLPGAGTAGGLIAWCVAGTV